MIEYTVGTSVGTVARLVEFPVGTRVSVHADEYAITVDGVRTVLAPAHDIVGTKSEHQFGMAMLGNQSIEIIDDNGESHLVPRLVMATIVD